MTDFSRLPMSVHGTAVSVNETAALFIGPSGSGKSTLALQMMALGLGLISDDLVWLRSGQNHVWAERPPQSTAALEIEARGVGLLAASQAPPGRLTLVVDLSLQETQRLPDQRTLRIGNTDVRCLHKVDTPAFPAMVLQYLKADLLG